jgi:hypothetical protein
MKRFLSATTAAALFAALWPHGQGALLVAGSQSTSHESQAPPTAQSGAGANAGSTAAGTSPLRSAHPERPPVSTPAHEPPAK